MQLQHRAVQLERVLLVDDFKSVVPLSAALKYIRSNRPNRPYIFIARLWFQAYRLNADVSGMYVLMLSINQLVFEELEKLKFHVGRNMQSSLLQHAVSEWITLMNVYCCMLCYCVKIYTSIKLCCNHVFYMHGVKCCKD